MNKINAPNSLIDSTLKDSKKNPTKGKTSGDVTSEFIMHLDKDLFSALVDIYKVDFEIFGYNIPQFNTL